MLVYNVKLSKCLALDEVFKMLITCCELFITQKQLTPVFLNIPSQYSRERQVVNNLDRGIVMHVLDAAINLAP